MTDLHAQLLAALDAPWEIWAPPVAAPALGAQRLALRAVVELHAPKDRGAGPTCAGYEIAGVGFTWAGRCKTLAAIAEQLGLPLPTPEKENPTDE